MNSTKNSVHSHGNTAAEEGLTGERNWPTDFDKKKPI